jgi:RDD family protein
MGRRIAALFVDWLIAYGLAALLMTFGIGTVATLSTAVLVIWFVLGAVSLRLFGFTPGQFALGLLVIPVDGRQHVGFGRALVRGVLIAVVIPALITDADGRGLQDKVTNTAVVRR